MPAMLPIPQNMVTSYLPEKPNGHQHKSERKAYHSEYFKLCSLCLLHWWPSGVEQKLYFWSSIYTDICLMMDTWMNGIYLLNVLCEC